MAPKAGLSREQVIDAAAVIADREGLEAVTLATVAAALGVRSPSLYSHVAGVDGLRRALGRKAATRLAAELGAAAAGHEADAGAGLRAVAHAYRTFGHDHRGLYAALLPIPRADDDAEGAAAAAEPVRVIATLLDGLGVAGTDHVDVIRAPRALLHGFVDLELGGGFGLVDPVDASFEAALDLVLGALSRRSGR